MRYKRISVCTRKPMPPCIHSTPKRGVSRFTAVPVSLLCPPHRALSASRTTWAQRFHCRASLPQSRKSLNMFNIAAARFRCVDRGIEGRATFMGKTLRCLSPGSRSTCSRRERVVRHVRSDVAHRAPPRGPHIDRSLDTGKTCGSTETRFGASVPEVAQDVRDASALFAM